MSNWCRICGFSWFKLIITVIIFMLIHQPRLVICQESDHLCSHVSGKPYHFQSVTRTAHLLYLIESDNVYAIPTELIRPHKSHVKIWDSANRRPWLSQKWFNVKWMVGELVPEVKREKLLSFEIYGSSYFDGLGLPIEHFESNYLRYVFPGTTYYSVNKTYKLERPIGRRARPYNTSIVIDGVTNRKGYFIEWDISSKRVVYASLLDCLLEKKLKKTPGSHPSFHLQFTSQTKAIFIDTKKNSPSSSDLITRKVPYGFIDKNDLYLIDTTTESVYHLPFVQLGSNETSSSQSEINKEIKLKKIPLDKFLFCKRGVDDPDDLDYTVDPVRRTEKILLIVMGVIVMSLVMGVAMVVYNIKVREPRNAAHALRVIEPTVDRRYKMKTMGQQFNRQGKPVTATPSSDSASRRRVSSVHTSSSSSTFTPTRKPPQRNNIKSKNRPLIQQSPNSKDLKNRTYEFSLSNTETGSNSSPLRNQRRRQQRGLGKLLNKRR